MPARIRKGDTVYVISGKDKNKTGTVLSVDPETQRVIVQGINMVTKHQRPTQRETEGKKLQKEAPLHLSKVMLVDPQTGKGTRVKIQVVDGVRKRVAAKTGNAL